MTVGNATRHLIIKLDFAHFGAGSDDDAGTVAVVSQRDLVASQRHCKCHEALVWLGWGDDIAIDRSGLRVWESARARKGTHWPSYPIFYKLTLRQGGCHVVCSVRCHFALRCYLRGSFLFDARSAPTRTNGCSSLMPGDDAKFTQIQRI
jgi:hypothetical protein